MSRKKILFAAVDIGWRIEHYTNFINKNCKDAKYIHSFVKHAVSSSQYKTEYTFHFQFQKLNSLSRWSVSTFFFIYSLFKYNTFYFFSGETLLTRKLRKVEFRIYKLLNKKVIMHFVGSDIRSPEYIIKKERNIYKYLTDKTQEGITNDWQKELIRDSISYANSMLVSTPDLLKILPLAKYLPVFIDYNKFYSDLNSSIIAQTNFFRTEKIKVLHSPSHYKIKGSGIVLKAIEKLQKLNIDFEFIFTPDLNIDTGSNYPVTRYQLFKLYSEADIVIDQMTIGWYGLQSIEALLANCHTFCYIEEELIEPYFTNCPIIPTDANKLSDDLFQLISNYTNPNLLFNQEWVKANHTIERNNRLLIESIFS